MRTGRDCSVMSTTQKQLAIHVSLDYFPIARDPVQIPRRANSEHSQSNLCGFVLARSAYSPLEHFNGFL